MIPIYEDKPVDTRVQHESQAGTALNVASSAERLQARLGADRAKMAQLAAPVIKEETVNQALQDVKDGNIDTESVAMVAKDVYRTTATKAYLADIELSGNALGTKIRTDQQARGQYDANSFGKAWASHSKATLKAVDDPQMREVIGNTLQRQGEQFGSQILSLQTSQQRQRQKESLTSKLKLDQEELKEAIVSNPERALELQGSIDSNIASLRASGFITNNKADEMRKGLGKEIYTESIYKDFKSARLEGKGDEFISKFADSDQKMFDEMEQARITGQMNAQMGRYRANQKAVATKMKDDVKDATFVYENGKVPENEKDILDSLPLVDENTREDFEIARTSHAVSESVKTLPILDQEDAVSKFEASAKNAKEIKLASSIRKTFEARKTLSENDPMELTLKDGNFEDIGSINIGDTAEEWTTGLLQREQISRRNIAMYGANSGALLKDNEAKQLSAWLDSPNTPIAQKLGFINIVEQNVPKSSNKVYNQLSDKGSPLIGFVGSLIRDGDNTKATHILEGQMILKEVPGIIAKKEASYAISGEIGNALQFAGQGQRDALYQAVVAYSAKLAEQSGDMDGTFDDFEDALDALTGGIGERNGQNYFLPKFKDEGDVEDYIDDLTEKDVPDFRGMTKEDGINVIQNGAIISSGKNKYRIRYNRAFLYNADGTPFELEIK